MFAALGTEFKGEVVGGKAEFLLSSRAHVHHCLPGGPTTLATSQRAGEGLDHKFVVTGLSHCLYVYSRQSTLHLERK